MKGHTEQSIHSHLLASHTHTHARTHTVKYLTLAYIPVVADIATADTRLSCAAVIYSGVGQRWAGISSSIARSWLANVSS